MLKQWRTNRALRRVQDGDGHPLQRLRWWQVADRSLFHLRPRPEVGQPAYAVDVRHLGDKVDGEVRASLYRDGRHHAVAKVPAVFPIEDGVIEVAVSGAGMKRCHQVTADGTERQLIPDPRSGAGRRARLERDHPTVSRSLAVLSVLALVIGLGLNLVQILEPLAQIPPVVERFGTFESPVQLPVWLNVSLGLLAALGATERALRLRYHWLLDGGGA